MASMQTPQTTADHIIAVRALGHGGSIAQPPSNSTKPSPLVTGQGMCSADSLSFLYYYCY